MHAFAVPRIDRTFNGEPQIMRALVTQFGQNATVLILMLLARKEVATLPGIGDTSAARISAIFAENDIPQREFSMSAQKFSSDVFGTVEAMSIEGLNVGLHGSTRRYLPLNLLNYLRQIEPHLTTGELMVMSSADIRTMLAGRINLEAAVFSRQLAEVITRLTQWGLTMTPSRSELYAVR